VPFLFLTGYDARAVMPSRFADVPCLSKPVSDGDFTSAIRRLLLAARQRGTATDAPA
jgi:hypothetical protein